MITRRALLMWLVWLILSLLAWRSTYLVTKGLYPDWDDAVGQKMAWIIRVALILSWSIWIISLLAKNKRAHFWFVFGVCFAFCFCIVRLQFMREVIALLNL
jgi:hypothetical protein